MTEREAKRTREVKDGERMAARYSTLRRPFT